MGKGIQSQHHSKLLTTSWRCRNECKSLISVESKSRDLPSRNISQHGKRHVPLPCIYLRLRATILSRLYVFTVNVLKTVFLCFAKLTSLYTQKTNLKRIKPKTNILIFFKLIFTHKSTYLLLG